MKTVKLRILCGIFGFYLTLALFVPQWTALCYGYFFRHEQLIDRVCTAQNAQAAKQGIIKACEELADPCGIPLSVYDDVFTVDAVSRDMRAGLKKALAFETYKVDTEKMEERLAENVREILREETGEEDVSASEKDVKAFSKQSMGYYRNFINLSAYRYFRTIHGAVQKYLLIGLGIFAFLTAIALFFFIRLLRRFGAVLRECAYAIVASGVCNFLLARLLEKEDLLARLQLSPTYFRDAIVSFWNGTIRFDGQIGLATAGIGLVFFLISVVVDSVSKKKKV